MKYKFITFCICLFIAVIFLGFYSHKYSATSKKIELQIKKIDNSWWVVEKEKKKPAIIKVKRNDKIEWQSEGTDVYFQFPKNIFIHERNNDTLKEGYTKFLKDGKKLKLKIRNEAQKGIYEYAVFCTANGEFAKGGSPPKIIVE